MGRPVKSSQYLLKYVKRVSGPVIHIRTGAMSMACLKRASLSRTRASSALDAATGAIRCVAPVRGRIATHRGDQC